MDPTDFTPITADEARTLRENCEQRIARGLVSMGSNDARLLADAMATIETLWAVAKRMRHDDWLPDLDMSPPHWIRPGKQGNGGVIEWETEPMTDAEVAVIEQLDREAEPNA